MTIKPIPEPPIPKLTIKTTPSDGTISSNSCDAVQLPSIPKLLIKPIPPKCTEIEMQSGSDENDSTENSIEASVENAPIPKLTLKTSSVDRMVLSDTTPTVPKLILKMGGNKIVCRDDLCSTSPSETVEENDNLSEKSSPEPEQASSELCDGNILPNESEQIISLLEDSESNMSTEKVADLPPSDLLAVHSVTLKQQSKASTIIRDNPDSPRIILKINKSSTSEVKAVTEPSPVANVVEDFNVESIVSSTMTNESKSDLQPITTTNADSQNLVENSDIGMERQATRIKRTLSEIESDEELEEKEPTKKIKYSQIVENINPTSVTVDDSSPLTCTVISDEDSNDMKTELCNEEPKQEGKTDISDEISEEKFPKLETETVCITIDDDSSSTDNKQQINEDVPMTNTDVNQTANSIVQMEEVTDVTPVKRGRGRPKKNLHTSITKQFPKETELDDKEDETPKLENSTEQKGEILKTPTRGRGRGRGRGGKTVEIVKDGKVLQVKMDAGYEDDDSPTFSIYNRYATTRGRGRGGRGKRGMGRVRKSVSNEGAPNSFDPNKTPNSSLVDLKVCIQ